MPRKMKESDSQLLGLLPSNWECNVVRRYYNIILGKMLCPEKLDESYSLEKYYCAANVHFDGVSDNGLKAMWFSPSEKREYGVREGDLLVVEGGAGAGGAAIAGRQRGFVGVQNSVMIVRPKKDADVRLLKYWLQVAVPSGYIDCVCNRATIPHFTKDKIGNMKIPYPPPAEQRRIAAYLDERCARIDGMIAEAKTSIEDYKKWKRSIIFEAVTGKREKNLKSSGIEWVGDIPAEWNVIANKYVMRKRKDICEHWDGEDVLSLSINGVIVRDLEHPTGKMPTTFDGYQYVKAGDALMCLFDYDVTPRCIGRAVCDGVTSPAYSRYEILPNADLNFVYYYYLMVDDGKRILHLARNLRHAFNEEDFGLIKMPLPPLPEQRRIAAELDEKCAAIDKLVGEKESLIADLGAYKKSLIFEAVTGKREVA